MTGQEDSYKISSVLRSKYEAEKYYNRISSFYDWLGGIFERKSAERALDYLNIQNGESVLEIGFGTGYCLQQIALLVGKIGKAYGIDISNGMLEVTRKRLEKASILDRVELYQGDASNLPYYSNDTFDAVLMSFTLELFDTPEIPQVLGEIKRVLKVGGRLAIVSLSKINGNSLAIRIYEWIHRKWPKYVDCRPIYLEYSLSKAGYEIQNSEMAKLMILPLEIVVASKKG
jgi:demethylmenaquinone methyltransferase/2-methoxy-6-polyprenyl-1,4-benzoquinol methylase